MAVNYIHLYCRDCEEYVNGEGHCLPNNRTAQTAWVYFHPISLEANVINPASPMIITNGIKAHNFAYHPEGAGYYDVVECSLATCPHLHKQDMDENVGF